MPGLEVGESAFDFCDFFEPPVMGGITEFDDVSLQILLLGFAPFVFLENIMGDLGTETSDIVTFFETNRASLRANKSTIIYAFQ